MSNKGFVLARFTSRQNIELFIKDELDDKLDYKFYFNENRIRTENLDIKCIIIPIGQNQMKYVLGMRSKICFGFDKEVEDYLTKGNSQYSGCLIDYILEKNGVYKKCKKR